MGRSKNEYGKKRGCGFPSLRYEESGCHTAPSGKFVDPEPFEMEEIEEDQEYREVIYTEYEKLDEVLADFDEDWNVMVFGTSGFEAENKREGFPSTTYALNVNPLIEELGYGNFTQETTRGTTLDNAESGTKAERCPLEYPKNDVINETTMQFRMCVLDDSLDIEHSSKQILRL